MTGPELSEHRQGDRSLTRLGRKCHGGCDAGKAEQLHNTLNNVFSSYWCLRISEVQTPSEC